MKKLLLSGAVATALAVSGPALAADMPVRAAPVVAPVTWAGWYFGIAVGGAFDRIRNTWPITDHFLAAGTQVDKSPSSWAAGLTFGSRWQFGSLVLGTETQALGTGLNRLTIGLSSDFATTETDNIGTTISTLVLSTVQLGFAWDHWLLAAKGGYATGNVGATWSDSVGHVASVSRWVPGWTAGVMAEHMIGTAGSIGLEYDYVHLNDRNFFQGLVTGDGAPGAPVFANRNVQANVHLVMARLNLRLPFPRW